MWRGHSQWSVIVSIGKAVASVVFYVHQMWLLAGWRVYGQVSGDRVRCIKWQQNHSMGYCSQVPVFLGIAVIFQDYHPKKIVAFVVNKSG